MITRTGHYLNGSLMSGSDSFRTMMGGYWQLVEEDDGVQTTVEFVPMRDNETTTWITTFTEEDFPIQEVMIRNSYYDASFYTASADSIIPTWKNQIRIVGNPDIVEDDTHWLSLSNKFLSSTDTIDISFQYEYPYAPLYIKSVDYENVANYQVANFTYNYNYYLPEYQNVRYGESVLLKPNYYTLISVGAGKTTADTDEDMYNLATVEGTVDPESLFSSLNTEYPPTYDITSADLRSGRLGYKDKLHNIKKYLSSSYSAPALSASSLSTAISRFPKIMFNRESQLSLFPTALEWEDRMPYMVKLNFPVDNSSYTWGDMIYDSGFENLMLSFIKDSFSFPHLTPNIIPYPYEAVHNVISSSLGVVKEYSLTTESSFNETNFYTMIFDTLSKQHAGFTTLNRDYHIPGGQSAAMNQLDNAYRTFRFSHSVPALDLLMRVNEYLDLNYPLAQDTYMTVPDILNEAGNSKYTETLAYRVRKLNTAQQTVQNFIVTNSNHISKATDGSDQCTLYDSQVRYGESYDYTVYAYVLVYGWGLRYEDWGVSRQIGSPKEISSGEVYCLEMINPTTGQPTPAAWTAADVSSVEITNELYTSAQINSLERYQAHMTLTTEPIIRIIEVPLYSKRVTVLDHPAPPIQLSKFQRMDDSQIIGLMASVDVPMASTFPLTVLPSDELYKGLYLASNDLLATEKNSNYCKSYVDKIQIFRKSERPLSFTDFTENDLIATKDLKIPGSTYTYSSCVYEEKIRTNTKIYYLLRAVSQNGTPGVLSTLVEVELVSDGGYKYATFDEKIPADFEEDLLNEVTTQFKKIFQLVPNINQLEFDTTEVDFDNNAGDEINGIVVGTSDDSIFGKTFKLRLTSKKTGKKIDLNVTYKLN